jgi:hypothetical protein
MKTASLLLLLTCCNRSDERATAAPNDLSVAPASRAASLTRDAPDASVRTLHPAQTTPTPAADEIVAKITCEGPLGHGRCTQKTYCIEVESGAADPAELHFERCPEDVGADLSRLQVGATYRFTLAPTPSPNFTGPRIIDAVVVKTP